jgi:hypothetical protein
VHATTCGDQRNLWKSVLSFHPVGPEDQTRSLAWWQVFLPTEPSRPPPPPNLKAFSPRTHTERERKEGREGVGEGEGKGERESRILIDKPDGTKTLPHV